MDFNLFSYYTLGRRSELEAGLAGLRVDLYQRMLDETAQIARAADEAGFAGMGHPEHHLQIEGCEPSNDLAAMAMFLGQHTERLRIISCGWVSTTHNPLRAAETIATLDVKAASINEDGRPCRLPAGMAEALETLQADPELL